VRKYVQNLFRMKSDCTKYVLLCPSAFCLVRKTTLSREEGAAAAAAAAAAADPVVLGTLSRRIEEEREISFTSSSMRVPRRGT